MKTELTEKQKEIYNIYLKELACSQKRPYRPRKDFSDIDDSTIYSLVKLDGFFNRNPEVDKNLFFKAGFVYSGNTYLTLSFFNNYSVIKYYTRLINEKYGNYIDSDDSVNDFIKGLKFVIEFVKDNKIKLLDYPYAVNEHGVKWILIHLKQQKISLYHIHAFEVPLRELGDDEILNIYLADFKKKFCDTKRQYLFSKRLKEIGSKVTLTKN